MATIGPLKPIDGFLKLAKENASRLFRPDQGGDRSRIFTDIDKSVKITPGDQGVAFQAKFMEFIMR